MTKRSPDGAETTRSGPDEWPPRAGILHNISWLGAGSVLVKPFWFIFITALCMRILRAEGYGVMNNGLALMMMFAPLADLGTGQLIVRDIARRRDRAGSYLSNILVGRLALAVPALLIGLLTGLLLQFSADELLALLFAGVYVMALRQIELCRSFYRAFEVLKYESISLVLEKVLVIAVGAAMLLAFRSAAGTLGGMAIGITATLVVNLAWIHFRLARFRLASLNWSSVRSLFRDALPLGAVMLLTMMYLRVGGVILEAVVDEDAAGQYYAAFRIVEALQALPTIVVAAVLPRLSSLFDRSDLGDFLDILRRSLTATAAISIPVAAALTLFGTAFISLLDPSPDFQAAGDVLRLVCWAFPLMTANYILVGALIASNEHRFLALTMFVVLFINAGVSFVLVQNLSYFGAAIGLLLSEGIVLIATGARVLSAVRRRKVDGLQKAKHSEQSL